MKYASWTLIVYQIFILLLVLNSVVTFGNGLGDLGMLIVYAIIVLTLIILHITAIRIEEYKIKRIMTLISIGLCFIAALSITLFITIWRGAEYPWNGHIVIA